MSTGIQDIRSMTPHLAVFDMPTSIKFYCDVLGFQIANTDGKPDFDWVMLKLNGVELMLNTAYDRSRRPAQADPARIAAHKDIILYFACPDVDAAYNHLRAKGVNVNPPKVAWYGMKQIYVTDPDGYLLCFQWGVKQPVPAG
jgi:catechol 2,3-dioxygenase-like lactoylglutathione lyase family enzyme